MSQHHNQAGGGRLDGVVLQFPLVVFFFGVRVVGGDDESYGPPW